MAEVPSVLLDYPGGCPDCGDRQVELPPPLPPVGDDFDWRVRDYDGFRLAMLEELAARFPERTRWTPADLEVVIVEVLAAVLDQLSDQLDRVTAEAYLESARRPESVRRHLALLGYDSVRIALARGQIALQPGETAGDPAVRRRLDGFWFENPSAMEEARQQGPRSVHDQHRMVTTDDYARRLEEHPLVLRAQAAVRWTGAWTTMEVALVLFGDEPLDALVPASLAPAVARFHAERGIRLPSGAPSIRTVLTAYVDALRMVGQEVVLIDAVRVPVTFSLSVRVAANYFQSEVRRALTDVLGTGPAGFFRPGRLRFGEDLHASDLIAAAMALDGVESVCLNRFRRLGSQFADQVASGRIPLAGIEVAICDNQAALPSRGYYRLTLHGGLKG
ncbi:MAG TPA: hypothetical protein VGX68_08730 [Thermoanaerobaculia bacterium]|jgi:hypothetical protein|nr:hypothetical protein [Thermoanaerobaculia bacterium]